MFPIRYIILDHDKDHRLQVQTYSITVSNAKLNVDVSRCEDGDSNMRRQSEVTSELDGYNPGTNTE